MRVAVSAFPGDNNEEIATLLETLFEAGKRLEELTGGQIDTLVDPDGRTFLLRGTQEQLLESEMARQAAILNGLAANIAVLDHQGKILSVNEAWRQFGFANGANQRIGNGLGVNYLEICDNARAEDCPEAGLAADGIRAVLAGDAKNFLLEYECHFSIENRWYLLTVSPLAQDRPHGAIVMHLDITARKNVEEELHRSDEKLRTLVLGIKDYAVLMLDPEGRITTWNEGAERIKGYRAEEIIGQHFSKFYTADAIAQDHPTQELKIAAKEGRYEEEGWRVRKDGSRFWAHVVIRALYAEAGKLIGFAKVTRDKTESMLAESQLLSLTERMSLATTAAKVGVWEWDMATGVLTWDATMFELYGISQSEPVTYEKWAARVHAEDLPSVEATFLRATEEKSVSDAAFRIVRPDGNTRHVSMVAKVALDLDAKVVRMIGVNVDITERHEAEKALLQSKAQMTYLAEHDSLTGLPNRSLVKDRIGQAIELAKRHGKTTALLFLDLDGFKHVNDSYGHATGDRLLQSVAQRLVDCVRTSDTVCRQGGDEFIVLLHEVQHPEDTAIAARRILDGVATVHTIAEQDLHVTCCIGISVYPDDGLDAETLIRNADIAMYEAKAHRRPGFQFFRPAMNVQAIERQFLEEGLRTALERREFALHYQPKINLTTGAISGVEALLRWTHPDRGFVSPAQFIPILEDCGLIIPVGNWVLREACRQAKEWVDVGLPEVRMAVNVSGVQLEAENFLEGLFTSLNETGLDPNWLELEVTESLLIKRTDFAASILRSIRETGVQVALDDFGTGYSSLSYLHRLPIDTLKVDQSFVRQITSAPNQTSIVSAIISMAQSLKMKVVAEGVETAEELGFLQQKSCDEAQGYYFSRPVPPDQFAALLVRQVLSHNLWSKITVSGASRLVETPIP